MSTLVCCVNLASVHASVQMVNCHGKHGSSGIVDHPLRISVAMQSGVVGRDGCSDAVGPHSRRSRMQTRRRSQVS